MNRGWYCWVFAVALLYLSSGAVRADTGESRIGFYCEEPMEWLPIRSVTAHTVVDGPLARTWVSYVLGTHFSEAVEVGFNLHVPAETVLTEFGYYYKGRYIRGRMYDNDEAWEIYQAVTSRGRDPGIMDRPTQQDYHAQIFPVEANHSLRVDIELVQVLATDARGFHLEVPIAVTAPGSDVDVAPDPKGLHIVLPPARTKGAPKPAVDAYVNVRGVRPQQLSGNRPDMSGTHGCGSTRLIPGGAAIHLKDHLRPDGPWVITIRRPVRAEFVECCSALDKDGSGFYALMLSPKRNLKDVRAILQGTSQSLPTRFGNVAAWDHVCVVGRYPTGARLTARFESRGHAPIRVSERLSGVYVSGAANMASRIWAEKRIDALQGSGRDVRTEVVRVSKRYNVVSNYTALLAIPQEELEYYRKVLAKQRVQTNTRSIGGGGGDPYISVKAPADSRQVVAIFPAGDTRSLVYNEQSQIWEGRFDIPMGTPAGEYRVTIIVVHRDGTRSSFILVYQNLLTSAVTASGIQMQAHRGSSVRVSVTGQGIERAVVVAPWGDRVTMQGSDGTWLARLNVPGDWPVGAAQVVVVLLDGAHNRTEITLDLEVK